MIGCFQRNIRRICAECLVTVHTVHLISPSTDLTFLEKNLPEDQADIRPSRDSKNYPFRQISHKTQTCRVIHLLIRIKELIGAFEAMRRRDAMRCIPHIKKMPCIYRGKSDRKIIIF